MQTCSISVPRMLMDSLNDELFTSKGGILSYLDKPADWANCCLVSKRFLRLGLSTPFGSLGVNLWTTGTPSASNNHLARNGRFKAGCKAWLERQGANCHRPGLPVKWLCGPTARTLEIAVPALSGLRHLELNPAGAADTASAAIRRLTALESLVWVGASVSRLDIPEHPGLRRLVLDQLWDEREVPCILPALEHLEVFHGGAVELRGAYPRLRKVYINTCPSFKVAQSCSLPALKIIHAAEACSVEFAAGCTLASLEGLSARGAGGSVVLGGGCCFPRLRKLRTEGWVQGLQTCEAPALEELMAKYSDLVLSHRFITLRKLYMISITSLELPPGCTLPASEEVIVGIYGRRPTERVALRGHLPVIRTLLLTKVENLVLTGSLPSLQALDLHSCKQDCSLVDCHLPALRTLRAPDGPLTFTCCTLPALHSIATNGRGSMTMEGCSLPALRSVKCEYNTSVELSFTRCSFPTLLSIKARRPRAVWSHRSQQGRQAALAANTSNVEASPGRGGGDADATMGRLEGQQQERQQQQRQGVQSKPAMATFSSGPKVHKAAPPAPQEQGSPTPGQGADLPAQQQLVFEGDMHMHSCSLPDLQSIELDCHSAKLEGCLLPALRHFIREGFGEVSVVQCTMPILEGMHIKPPGARRHKRPLPGQSTS